MPPSSSAPVESITRGSSCGMNGSVTGSEPAAMIACSKLTVFLPPSACVDLELVERGEPARAAEPRSPCAAWPARRGRRSAS